MPTPKGYSPPASTQSFALDVKHLNHQLRHIDGSRSVAQDARVSEHGLRNHVPTALDLVKGNDRRRSARPHESIRRGGISVPLRVEVNLLRGRSHTESLRKRLRGIERGEHSTSVAEPKECDFAPINRMDGVFLSLDD